MNSHSICQLPKLVIATINIVLFAIVVLWGFDTAMNTGWAEDKPEQKMKRLARHRTLAKYQGAPYHLCRGRTALCPERCGDSGEFATFGIVAYLVYEKPGKYGDPKQEIFRFQISDFDRKPKGEQELLAKVSDLEEGDLVLLEWHHLYGEVRPGVISPVRPVIELIKVSEQEAAKLREKDDASKSNGD